MLKNQVLVGRHLGNEKLPSVNNIHMKVRPNVTNINKRIEN
jgi:hypothetical protein